MKASTIVKLLWAITTGGLVVLSAAMLMIVSTPLVASLAVFWVLCLLIATAATGAFRG